MSTLAEAVKRALEQKRQQDVERRNSVAEGTVDGHDIRYVRCRHCRQVEQWDAFVIMHGGKPHFCRCKPGDEELETFTITVPREGEEDK